MSRTVVFGLYIIEWEGLTQLYSVWALSVSPEHLWYMYQQKSSVTGKPSRLHSKAVKALSDDAIKHLHYTSSGFFFAAVAFIFSLRGFSVNHLQIFTIREEDLLAQSPKPADGSVLIQRVCFTIEHRIRILTKKNMEIFRDGSKPLTHILTRLCGFCSIPS